MTGMTVKDPVDRETSPGVHQGEEIGKGVRRADFGEPGRSELSSQNWGFWETVVGKAPYHRTGRELGCPGGSGSAQSCMEE